MEGTAREQAHGAKLRGTRSTRNKQNNPRAVLLEADSQPYAPAEAVPNVYQTGTRRGKVIARQAVASKSANRAGESFLSCIE